MAAMRKLYKEDIARLIATLLGVAALVVATTRTINLAFAGEWRTALLTGAIALAAFAFSYLVSAGLRREPTLAN